MNGVPARMTVWLLVFAVACRALPTDAKSAIAEAARSGQFLFLTFYEAKDAAFAALTSSAEAFRKASPKKISSYAAVATDPANKEMVEKFGIRGSADMPILLVIAPNGVITGGYPRTVTPEQLKQGVGVTDLMLKVLKPLQERKVALVALQNQSTKLNAESWQGVNEFANDANYKQLVTAIKADPSAAGSQEFVKQCGLLVPLTEAAVVVLLPPGSIGKILSGKVTKADILASLQACAAGSSCKPGACSDRRFKQNVTPIDSALAKVAKLQGVTFTWDRAGFPRRFFPEGSEIGLIAQDVEEVVPEVVLTDAEGYKSISYDKLTAVLIEATKDLQTRIDGQDSLITVLQERIRALETVR